MPTSSIEKLKRFYTQFSGNDRVLVMINADPDAIASAMAIKRLLWRRVSAVTISNINVIERPDNLTMIRLLGIEMTHVKKIRLNQFSRFVIVDSQQDHHDCFSMFRSDVIIDHHPETCAVANFTDIRPKYGAVATIMTEYLRAARIKPSMKLATALFHAIKTDTSNFERQTAIEDVRAFQFLYRYANVQLAQKIEGAEIRIDFLKYFSKAFKEYVIRRGRVFVHLGEVAHPDVCVLIADFFMRVSTVKWSIVSGLHDNKLVIILRNNGLHNNAGKTAMQVFGRFGSAGGHKSMARAEVALNEMDKHIEYKSHKKVLAWLISRIEKNTEKKT